ncbi:hypothetical protein DVW12_10115 [Clostridium botulinum]|nr:hypothetical protein [Clostridium botulinum]
MIINLDREPKYSLLYIGSVILDILEKKKGILIDDLYLELKNSIDNNLHIDFLYYAIDWLYMLSVINLNRNQVTKC